MQETRHQLKVLEKSECPHLVEAFQCTTQRTSALSMPIPKAMVLTTMLVLPCNNAQHCLAPGSRREQPPRLCRTGLETGI